MSSDTKIEVDGFGIVPNCDENQGSYEFVRRYTLTNKSKASIRLITWGAGIQSIRVPNKQGILGDIISGFDDIEGYIKNRFIGRILSYESSEVFNEFIQRQDSPLIDTYGRDKLNDCSTDNVNWDSFILDKQVVMSHLNYNGNRYRGKSSTQIRYSWTDENELHINIRASSTRPIPIDITNCYLFNLSGHGMGPDELKNHVITINANEWIDMNSRQKRQRRSIDFNENCIFDSRHPILLDPERFNMIHGGGYNHYFSQNEYDESCYRFHARVLHPSSGRFLEVSSNQRGLYFHIAGDLQVHEKKQPISRKYFWKRHNANGGSSYSKDGTSYGGNGAFVISPRSYKTGKGLDKTNILQPGHVYHHNMTLKFGVNGPKT